MIPICDNCQYSKSDCKGNKSPEKIKFEYYKKPVVFNAKEAAERIAVLELENAQLKGVIRYYEERIDDALEGEKLYEWRELPEDAGYICGHCNRYAAHSTTYCPWCGAKMKEEDRNV